MRKSDLPDLLAFSIVAEEGNFSRAAVRLGVSQSALSHAVKALEQRLGIRLLSRTTRSVATTEAGEELLRVLQPALDDIEAGLANLDRRRALPSGTVRLTMIRFAATSIIEPMLPAFIAEYPDVEVEIAIDDGFTDIVAKRFDAGIRLGGHIEQDMVAVRVGPDIRAAVVASPAYLATHPAPSSPPDLIGHDCLVYRFASGALFAWPFERAGERLEVSVRGRLVFNDGDMIRAAAVAGHGVAYLYEEQVADLVVAGRLVRLIEDWCPLVPGYHLYHSSRRQQSPALAALIAMLRQPGLSSEPFSR